MAKGNYFKFDLSHYTVAGLFILESTIVWSTLGMLMHSQASRVVHVAISS